MNDHQEPTAGPDKAAVLGVTGEEAALLLCAQATLGDGTYEENVEGRPMLDEVATLAGVSDVGSLGSPIEESASRLKEPVLDTVRRTEDEHDLSLLIALCEAAEGFQNDDRLATDAVPEAFAHSLHAKLVERSFHEQVGEARPNAARRRFLVPSADEAIAFALAKVEELYHRGALDEGTPYSWDRLVDNWVEAWCGWADHEHQGRILAATTKLNEKKAMQAYRELALRTAHCELLLARQNLLAAGLRPLAVDSIENLLEGARAGSDEAGSGAGALTSAPRAHLPGRKRRRMALDHVREAQQVLADRLFDHRKAKRETDEAETKLLLLQTDTSYADEWVTLGDSVKQEIRLRLAVLGGDPQLTEVVAHAETKDQLSVSDHVVRDR